MATVVTGTRDTDVVLFLRDAFLQSRAHNRELQRLLAQARDVACRLEDEIAHCPHPTHGNLDG